MIRRTFGAPFGATTRAGQSRCRSRCLAFNRAAKLLRRRAGVLPRGKSPPRARTTTRTESAPIGNRPRIFQWCRHPSSPFRLPPSTLESAPIERRQVRRATRATNDVAQHRNVRSLRRHVALQFDRMGHHELPNRWPAEGSSPQARLCFGVLTMAKLGVLRDEINCFRIANCSEVTNYEGVRRRLASAIYSEVFLLRLRGIYAARPSLDAQLPRIRYPGVVPCRDRVLRLHSASSWSQI